VNSVCTSCSRRVPRVPRCGPATHWPACARSAACRPPSAAFSTSTSRAVVYELQGDLRFATIEPVLRDVVGAGDELQFAVFDFKRVTHVDGAATRMLARFVDGCAARGQHTVLTRVRRGEMLAGFGPELDPHSARAVSFQPQLDLGLGWCERGLLERHGVAGAATPPTRSTSCCVARRA
jgi:ABC-type transporter Mla MlaB component